MFLLIVFALVAIGFSFLCSILEAALLSITPSYIAGLKGERPKLFEKLRKLKDDIDDPGWSGTCEDGSGVCYGMKPGRWRCSVWHY